MPRRGTRGAQVPQRRRPVRPRAGVQPVKRMEEPLPGHAPTRRRLKRGDRLVKGEEPNRVVLAVREPREGGR